MNSNTGANQDNANRMRSKNYIEIDSTKSYIWGASVSNGVCLYDASKTFISTKFVASNGIINQLPSNAKYMRFWCPFTSGTTYANDICIEEGATSHGYVPYFSDNLLINVENSFPNGMCSAGEVRDELDLANGIATKKIGVVDLGTLTWAYENNNQQFRANLADGNLSDGQRNLDLLCARYYVSARFVEQDSNPHIRGILNSMLYIVDTEYTDASAFKTSLNGVLLYYRKGTPTTTTISKAKAYYKVSQNGKEIAVSEGLSAPLVADIAYRGMSAEDLINELNG